VQAVVLFVLLATACGRVGFDTAATSDASPVSCVTSAPLPPPTSAAFGTPQLLADVNAPGFDDDPSLTSDLLEIYFQSIRSGTARIWRSVRANTSLPWPTPEPVLELDPYDANTPEISRDGLRLDFSMTDPQTSSAGLFALTRTSRTSPWSSPERIGELISGAGETGLARFAGERGVLFFSGRPGGPGGGDLWEALVEGPECMQFGEASPLLGSVNTPGAEANAWMREDGLVVVYQATRAGGTGTTDLYVATRGGMDEPFGDSTELVELDSGAVDDDPWLNDTMTTIVFMSARTGDAELYIATR
jgi:hypothetical protein